MKFHLLKPLTSTTLIAALLTSATPVLAAPADTGAAETAAAAPSEISDLTLEQAIDKAISSSMDLNLLKLDSESAYYTTLQALMGTRNTKVESVRTLSSAKSKFETEAKAIKDYKVAESNWKIKENDARLNVHKAYYEVLAAKEKADLQKKYADAKNGDNSDAQKTLRELEETYREALAKLNQLMNEKSDQAWNLAAVDYSTFQLLPIEEYKKIAHQKRPDLVKASAEVAFYQAKVNYIREYAALSTYPGRIAQIELKKYELLLQSAQRKADAEITANYEKVVQAKQALEESIASQKAAEERYRQTYMDYLNKTASASELANRKEKWLDSIAERIDSTHQYNVAVATLQHSIGF